MDALVFVLGAITILVVSAVIDYFLKEWFDE